MSDESALASTGRPAVPPLACDSHMHVFGPLDRYPGAGNRTYTPSEMGLDSYAPVAGKLGLERLVFVQPSAYGTDNSCLLEDLERNPDHARGIAVIEDALDDAALRALDLAGIRGIRLNLMSPRVGNAEDARAALEQAARRIEWLGWHIQIYADLALVRQLAPAVRRLSVPVVFDHMGGAKKDLPTTEPGFAELLGLLAEGRCWVKLSGADIVTWETRDFSGAAPFARALIAANSRQLVWGTDWPHLVHHASGIGDAAPPASYRGVDEEALLAFLWDWTGDDATWRRILVDNPARLYGF